MCQKSHTPQLPFGRVRFIMRPKILHALVITWTSVLCKRCRPFKEYAVMPLKANCTDIVSRPQIRRDPYPVLLSRRVRGILLPKLHTNGETHHEDGLYCLVSR